MTALKLRILRLLPLIILLVIWQMLADRSPHTKFLFASPFSVIQTFVVKISNGELPAHMWVTGSEAFTGFALGVTLGSLIGFALLYFPFLATISRPYVIALGSIPVFALAPMLIVWFGISFTMKVAMAFFATVLVALSQAYEGGKNVDPELEALFTMNGASRQVMFRKLILPSSMDWVLASLKLNIGFALLGAFIGEFIASEKGLGYIMLKAGGTYDVPYVLAAALCIIILAFIFNFFVTLVERHRNQIIQFITVPPLLR